VRLGKQRHKVEPVGTERQADHRWLPVAPIAGERVRHPEQSVLVWIVADREYPLRPTTIGVP
jgi:hypothetical protein